MQFNVTIEGRIIKADPELFATPNGNQGTRFQLVHSPRYRNADGEWTEGRAQFFDIVCWGKLAQNVLENLRQGDIVIVDANQLYAHASGNFGHLKVNASNISLSLRFDAARSDRARDTDTEVASPTDEWAIATPASV